MSLKTAKAKVRERGCQFPEPHDCGAWLEACHIISVRSKSLAELDENMICLCERKHKYFTSKHPGEWPAFVDSIYGEGHYMKLKRLAANPKPVGCFR